MKTITLCCLMVALTLAGCASTSPDDICRKSDSHGLGKTDGIRGEPADNAAARVEQCKAYGVAINIEQYTKGYVEGIKQYCSYEGGKKAGAKGRLYKAGTCPMALSDEFIRGYQEGREEYEAGRALNRTSRY